VARYLSREKWNKRRLAQFEIGDNSHEEKMVRRLKPVLALLTLAVAGPALAETLSPEADACKASGLLALKEKYPQVKDVLVDLDTPIRTVVIGDAYIERTKSTKPQTLVCVIGDKGKVLLTLFTDR
jgi:hypothetical protein